MDAILEAHGLCKNFGAVTAAVDISASITKDTVVGLIGANGAGKTTFINMITGYLKPPNWNGPGWRAVPPWQCMKARAACGKTWSGVRSHSGSISTRA